MDRERKKMNQELKKSTIMKNKKGVIFPMGRSANKEAVLEVRMKIWLNIESSIIEKETKDGKQITDQLTK